MVMATIITTETDRRLPGFIFRIFETPETDMIISLPFELSIFVWRPSCAPSI
jgi:hypothetical protein